MKVISMVPAVDADIDTEYYFIRANEYAFIHHKLRGEQVLPQKGLKTKGDEHSIGLVIFHDSQSVNFQSEAERNSLKLHYFILLTSRRELFPKDVTEKGGFKSMMQELSDLLTTVYEGH
ncbi:hypothetical protein KUTeg_015965 [Tegillarca granosa]|uniref:Uncharacterized protein n=1 Tax=Tegillarca granosa TaxID=220873 RepID=A0ABQ9EJR2_TEGGR|nr:hypothetical protein KUTeg_015965 [Tegillarca granosa]